MGIDVRFDVHVGEGLLDWRTFISIPGRYVALICLAWVLQAHLGALVSITEDGIVVLQGLLALLRVTIEYLLTKVDPDPELTGARLALP